MANPALRSTGVELRHHGLSPDQAGHVSMMHEGLFKGLRPNAEAGLEREHALTYKQNQILTFIMCHFILLLEDRPNK